MDNAYIKLLIEATIVFVGIFLFNYFIFVRKNKKLNKNEMPLELTYLAGIYGINPQKIKFRRFQYTYCLINSFIITTTYLLVMYLIKTALMRVILGITILVLLIIICYGILGRYYLYKEGKEKTNEIQEQNDKTSKPKKKKKSKK